jgi:lysyl endopeptidase
MRFRQFSVWLMTLLFLAATSPLMAQSSDSTTFLPLINQQAPGGNATEVEVAAYADSIVSPPVEAPVEQVIPFSLREVAAATAATTAADIRLPPLDVEQLLREDQAKADENSALRIGVVRILPQAVSAAGAEGSPGHWHTTSEGGSYWTLTIESPEAKAMRVHLENLTIPDGGHVMVYNRNNVTEIYGPYRQSDLYGFAELWTASIFGPVVTLEYYVPPGVEPAAVAGLQVTEITHLYVDLSTLLSPQLLTCHNDLACNAGWASEGNGVAGLGTIGGTAGVLWCSGALLNDFDNDTFVGYFLTANHCLNGSDSALGTQAQANTVEYYWRYQRPTCNGTAPDPATVPRTATGADLISRQTRNAGNDHAFLRIRGALPGGLTFAGWDTTAFSNGNASTGIHHPDGSFKRISFGTIHSSDTNYWNVNWSSGTTEPGSSGSPVFDSSRRLRGQLWGDNRTCPAAGATARSVYGRFNVTYPNIRRWMEIGGTINVNSSYTGVEEGTPTRPFRTASAAHSFAWNGARIKFRTGSYPGPITFTKQVTLIADGGMVTIGN